MSEDPCWLSKESVAFTAASKPRGRVQPAGNFDTSAPLSLSHSLTHSLVHTAVVLSTGAVGLSPPSPFCGNVRFLFS